MNVVNYIVRNYIEQCSSQEWLKSLFKSKELDLKKKLKMHIKKFHNEKKES